MCVWKHAERSEGMLSHIEAKAWHRHVESLTIYRYRNEERVRLSRTNAYKSRVQMSTSLTISPAGGALGAVKVCIRPRAAGL